MKTTIELAREVYGAHTEWSGAPLDRLEQLVALVRADQDEKYKWDIHSCGPTCTKAACVAMREAVEVEREACAKFVDHILKEGGGTWGDAIRNRGNP
jgi:predicted amidohydrolase YtcJ